MIRTHAEWCVKIHTNTHTHTSHIHILRTPQPLLQGGSRESDNRAGEGKHRCHHPGPAHPTPPWFPTLYESNIHRTVVFSEKETTLTPSICSGWKCTTQVINSLLSLSLLLCLILKLRIVQIRNLGKIISRQSIISEPACCHF